MCDVNIALSTPEDGGYMAQDPRSRTRCLGVRRVPVVVLVCLFGFFSMGRLPLLVAQSTLGDPLPEVLKNEQDDSTLRRFEAQKLAMGVLFKLVGYAESEEQARFATAEAFSRIDFLNSVFSDYDPSSETSRLSRDASPGNWLGVSSDMHRVLSTSQKISKASSGAFDLTVGPLSHLWRNVRKTQSLPAIGLLEAAQQKVDAQSVEVHPFAHLVRFKRGNIDLDFGGIAKGYAADQALIVLRENGVRSALIDASGDVSFSDPPPGRSSWVVAVAPLEKNGPPVHRLSMKQNAVATSGDAWQFVEIEGVRYSHIIDPRTGWAIRGRQSVTIIGPDGAKADAWASALSVMGHQEGLTLVETLKGIEALYIVANEGAVQTYQSSGFESYLHEAPVQERAP